MPIEQVNTRAAESAAPRRRRILPSGPGTLPRNPGFHSGHTVFILVALAVLGVLLVLISTRWDIGVSSDSTSYIEGARNLVRGHGFSSAKEGSLEPITHWPPFYSMVLAGFGVLGMDPAAGARILGAVLLGANILLVGLVAGKEGGPTAALVSGLLMVSSFSMLSIHAMAWSEPLFLFGTVLGLYLVILYVRRPTKRALVGSAVVIGLAFLTRYPGVALIAAAVLSILLLSRQSWRRRVAHSVIFLAISTGPLLAWSLSNSPAGRGVGSRQLSLHPPGLEHLKIGLGTVAAWVIPAGLPVRIRVLLFLVVAAVLVFFLATRTPWQRAGAVIRRSLFFLVWAIFVAMYLALLTISITLFDAHISFEARILSPVYLIGVFLISIPLPALYARATPRSKRVLASALAAFLLISFAQNAIWAGGAHRDGLGYTSRAWRESEIIEIVRALPSGIPIYSNADDVLHFYTGKPAFSLPWKWDPFSRRANPDYPVEFAALLAELREREGVVVFSHLIEWRDYLLPQEELERACGLAVMYRGEEGAIYQAHDVDGCS